MNKREQKKYIVKSTYTEMRLDKMYNLKIEIYIFNSIYLNKHTKAKHIHNHTQCTIIYLESYLTESKLFKSKTESMCTQLSQKAHIYSNRNK